MSVVTVESTSWHSYPSIFNLGHFALDRLFEGHVVIEEKVDGSQFSFGVFDGLVRVRSKGQEWAWDAPNGMFDRAVVSVLERKGLLKDGWTYRGEYLKKPKHNSLGYARVPEGHIVIFDINTGHERYLTDYGMKYAEAKRIGLECVPLVFEGEFSGGADDFRQMIDRESLLGGVKVEGVVIKNYAQLAPDKKVLMGKHVSEAFKEVHQKEWKKSNPAGKDILQTIGDALKTNARWEKAIQHLRDDGRITDTPADIGPLMKELHADLDKEALEFIRSELMKWALPAVKRMACHGFPEWYKQRLVDRQFDPTPSLGGQQ